jgi:hypothetical protein
MMKVKPCLICLTLLASVSLSIGNQARADLVLASSSSSVVVTFNDFIAPNPWANAGGTSGALDWNTWAFSNGSPTQVQANFGSTTGIGRGISAGGVTTNGIYAFDVASGIRGLGFQATADFGSPGSFTASVLNNTGGVLDAVSVSYTAWYRNDATREGLLRPLFSLTNNNTAGSYSAVDPTNVGLYDILSPAAADSPVTWVSNDRFFTLAGLNLQQGDRMFLRLGFSDSGSGSRDEWAISRFSVAAVPEPSSLWLGLALTTGLLFRRSRL